MGGGAWVDSRYVSEWVWVSLSLGVLLCEKGVRNYEYVATTIIEAPQIKSILACFRFTLQIEIISLPWSLYFVFFSIWTLITTWWLFTVPPNWFPMFPFSSPVQLRLPSENEWSKLWDCHCRQWNEEFGDPTNLNWLRHWHCTVDYKIKVWILIIGVWILIYLM